MAFVSINSSWSRSTWVGSTHFSPRGSLRSVDRHTAIVPTAGVGRLRPLGVKAVAPTKRDGQGAVAEHDETTESPEPRSRRIATCHGVVKTQRFPGGQSVRLHALQIIQLSLYSDSESLRFAEGLVQLRGEFRVRSRENRQTNGFRIRRTPSIVPAEVGL